MTSDHSPPPRHLVALLQDELTDRPASVRLVLNFWHHRRAYQGQYARTLFEIAKGLGGDGWEERCLAALMLQHQWACLPITDVKEHADLLFKLGLKRDGDASGPLDKVVLSEGYSTTRLVPFLSEFRRRLTRRMSLHRELRRKRPPLRAWQTFLLLRHEECSIELARYFFSASEVVERVVASLSISEGSPARPQTPLVPQEAEATLERWPPFERAIAESLIGGRSVYWSTGATPSHLNSLVSRPPGTVVLIVKPPGSRLEIEIKRTGKGEDLPLVASYERSGRPVPRSHRLDGGSMALSLRFEAAASASYATVYRTVWRCPAPVPTSLSVRFIDTLPVDDHAEHIIDYFTNAEVFKDKFAAMRSQLALCVERFEYEGCSGLPELESDRGLTVRFLHYTAPGQAILAGTSKFRLSVLARYLEPIGADSYLDEVSGTSPRVDRARRMADTLMEEILGLYHPPGVPYREHGEYLGAAFEEPRNRARADRIFRSLMQQIGTFWGTMLAIRGHSFGESLVARNAGIATCWLRGRWCVKLVFMDHDNLYIPAPDLEQFHPHFVLDGTSEDWNYAIGDSKPGAAPVSLVDFLRRIYRVGPSVATEGDTRLRLAIARAYRRARRAVVRRPELRGLFSPEFLEASAAWERRVALHLRRKSPPEDSNLARGTSAVEGDANERKPSDGGTQESEFNGYEGIIGKLYQMII